MNILLFPCGNQQYFVFEYSTKWLVISSSGLREFISSSGLRE